MTKLTWGGLEDDGARPNFKFRDIPEVIAIETVTGKDLQEALDDQALATRASCANKVCGAFATASAYSGTVEIDTHMGGYIDGTRVFVAVESGCSSGRQCPDRKLASILGERVSQLPGVCARAIEEADEFEQGIKLIAKNEAAAILAPAQAKANEILKPARDLIAQLQNESTQAIDANRHAVFQEALQQGISLDA